MADLSCHIANGSAKGLRPDTDMRPPSFMQGIISAVCCVSVWIVTSLENGAVWARRKRVCKVIRTSRNGQLLKKHCAWDQSTSQAGLDWGHTDYNRRPAREYCSPACISYTGRWRLPACRFRWEFRLSWTGLWTVVAARDEQSRNASTYGNWRVRVAVWAGEASRDSIRPTGWLGSAAAAAAQRNSSFLMKWRRGRHCARADDKT